MQDADNKEQLLRGGVKWEGGGDIWELCTSIQFFCKVEPALRNKLYELKKKEFGRRLFKRNKFAAYSHIATKQK